MAQLGETLRYKSGGRGFDSRWCHWNFSLTQSFHPHYDPGVDSASNRNKYQEHFLGVKTAVWNLVADIAGGKEAEGVWEHGVEENIWT